MLCRYCCSCSKEQLRCASGLSCIQISAFSNHKFTEHLFLISQMISPMKFFSLSALNLIKCMKDSELLCILNYTTCYVVLGVFKLKSVEVVWLGTASLDALAYPYLLLTKVCLELNNTEPAFLGHGSVSDTWSGKCLCTNFKLWLYICFY